MVVDADEASFEQGGVGTSVYRAFLLFGRSLPILKLQAVITMARARKSQQEIDEQLDEALSETFPASDPVSLGRNDHPGKPAAPSPEKPDKRE
ncbi:MAG TPA: hypothetical protein VL101_07940 [Nordella sp.]|nr:hypothetical protein [Nordella sp.]